jgi:RNA polymerase sigma-70 factor, ECF subfamily
MPSLDFEQVYRDHVQQVGRWAGWLVGSSGDAEDVVQDVFLTAHRLLPGFRGDARISTWLFRLTANAARHHRRRRERRRWLLLGAQVLSSQEPPAATPEDQLRSSQELALVREALDDLPEKYRTVLILSRLEGMSGEQIAELTDTKLSTVWVRLHRAREALTARFEKLRNKAGAPHLVTNTKQLGGRT